jgi:phosphatidate cytidylyltransferase
MPRDRELLLLYGLVLGLLVVATGAGWVFRRRLTSPAGQAFAANFLERTYAWWKMVAIFAVAMLTGGIGSLVLFALVSLLALREYLAVVPTARADHRALFHLFFLITPVQYLLIGANWYGLFAIFIPVYCFLILPMRIVVAGDCDQFLARAAKLHWGLMACVYCVSHAPAIMRLELAGYSGQGPKLFFVFVFIVEFCDVCQYLWGKTLGRHKVVPTVSPGKTWEGLIGGVLSAGGLGAALAWATPFTPWQAFGLACAVGLLGFFGDITMSAIKRDAHIKDYGALLPGHGGVLDRIDSLCFAAPFFFHVVRFYFTDQAPVGF